MSGGAKVWEPQTPVATISNYSSVVPQVFTATSGQLVFNITAFAYVPGTKSIMVFVNGSVKIPEVDVVETDSNTFTLVVPSVLNDTVLVVGFIGSINAVVDPYYLGPKATAPTVDNQGVTLGASHEGYTYWNTATNNWWTWTGTVWGLTSSSVATSANLVSIADAGGYFSSSDVEAALQEISSDIRSTVAGKGSALIGSEDAGSYFTGSTVESQLQQLGGISAASIFIGGTLTAHKDLRIKNNVTTPNTKVDVDTTSILVETTASVQTILNNVNLTIDMGVVGANGIDTSSIAANTWYHIWVIYNGSITAGLISTSSTAPAMPSGYTYKGYVGAIYSGSSTTLIKIEQRNNVVSSQTSGILGGISNTFVDITGLIVPTTAMSVQGRLEIYDSAAAAGQRAATISPKSTISTGESFGGYCLSGAAGFIGSFDTLLLVDQTIKYIAGTNAGINIYTHGWKF